LQPKAVPLLSVGVRQRTKKRHGRKGNGDPVLKKSEKRGKQKLK